MKIEIGESLGYSYLRHVKQCWLVQTNWKAPEHWEKAQADGVLENEFQNMRHRFDPDGTVFKKTTDSSQFLKQAEIDVVGVDQDGGVHAMEVAFHEAGLNYGGGADKRVLKKLLRTKLILDAYGPAGTRRDIYFASPKVNPGVSQPLEDVFSRLREEYPSVHWHLMTNEKFTSELLEPTLGKAREVADTSELFVRSFKLLELAGADSDRRSGDDPETNGATRKGYGPTARVTPGTTNQSLQDIVKELMRTLLEDYPTLLGDGDLPNLMDPDYCERSIGLQLGSFALLRRQEDGTAISGHNRYWSRVYGGQYFVTNNWWKDHHSRNAESLLQFVEKLIGERQGNPGIAALEAHRVALQNYLG